LLYNVPVLADNDRRVRRRREIIAKWVVSIAVLKLAIVDLPLLTGAVIIDRRVPDRPGHLQEVLPDPLILLAELLLIATWSIYRLRLYWSENERLYGTRWHWPKYL
jgi:hypothetical protein